MSAESNRILSYATPTRRESRLRPLIVLLPYSLGLLTKANSPAPAADRR